MCALLQPKSILFALGSMDCVVQARLKNEEELVLNFGMDEIPQPDWAWSIIDGKDGGRERHGDCVRGYHEFVWMFEVWEHVCFFCLKAEELSDDEAILDMEDE